MTFGLSPCCNAVLWTKPYNGTFECFECGIEYRIVDDNYTLEEVASVSLGTSDTMRHWRKTLKNLWIDKRCDICKENLEIIETGLLKRTEVIVITFDLINRGEQHVQIFDTTVARDREFTIGELV